MGEGEEEGQIWARGGHQQEAQHAASSSSTLSSKRVSSREAHGDHLQDKHGKEAQRETSQKQEQSGQYIYNLKLNSKRLKYVTSCFREI